MTPDARTLHFLAAIEARPDDRLVRDALSDYLRDEGHGDWAEAVRATAGKWPRKFFSYSSTIGEGVVFGWALQRVAASRFSNVPEVTWGDLRGVINPHSSSWKDYPTFAAAMFDLWRAWVAVNRQEVTV